MVCWTDQKKWFGRGCRLWSGRRSARGLLAKPTNRPVIIYIRFFMYKSYDFGKICKACCRSNLTVCRNIFGKNPEDPPIGYWLVLMHFWIDLIEPVYLSTWIILFFSISEKLWYKTCFPSPGSLGRDLTDLPSCRISTRIYVGTQWIILYVELVLGST
jgi:hypothetical protein